MDGTGSIIANATAAGMNYAAECGRLRAILISVAVTAGADADIITDPDQLRSRVRALAATARGGAVPVYVP